MSSECELIISVWEHIRDHIPAAKRSDVAKDLLYAFADYGFEATDLASIVDEDPDLNDAFEEVFQPLEDEDKEYEEDDE